MTNQDIEDLLTLYDDTDYDIRYKPGQNQEKLYHYTSPDSLLKILQKDKVVLWFSRHDCLNDISEGKEMFEHYKRACEELKTDKKIDDEFFNNIVNLEPFTHKAFCIESEQKNTNFIDSLEYETFVCCFSEQSDSLDLWRYYSKNDKFEGYNIYYSSYMFYELDLFLKKNNCEFKLSRVIYDSEEKNRFYKDKILRCYELYKNGNAIKQIAKVLSYILQHTQLIFKHSCFASEKEIRAIIYLPRLKSNSIEIKYRTNKGVIIPYIEAEFYNLRYTYGVNIAPLLNDELAIITLKKYLDQNGYYNCTKIKKSQLPIRY